MFTVMNWFSGKLKDFATSELKIGKLNCTAIELDGYAKAKKVWKDFPKIDAIVFIIDASDISRFPASKNEFTSILSDEQLSHCPILILGNKIDVPGAHSEMEIRAFFLLKNLTGKLHIPEEGISALSNDLLNSFEKSNQEHEIEENRKKLENQDNGKDEGCVGSVVAQHYNQLSERGVAERKESRIFHMRNLNNWIKSRIIGNILDRIRKENGPHCRLNVLDLGCGKGGDLLKWERGHVHHVVCADIAETSIEQCKERYAKLKSRSRQVFTAEFIATDCSKTSVMEKMENPELKIDLVSCQFAFHYSFESLPQAEQMLANVSSNLQPGGYFIGTTTDAYDIMRRLGRDQNSNNRKFGNGIFSVEFPPETPLDPPPLFGAKYNFHLEEVVDCPEFLVHFPTFEKLASKYGLKLVKKTRFEEFVPDEIEGGKELLMRMKALEAYPPFANQESVGQDRDDYVHAQEHIDSSGNAEGFRPKIGTLSKAEWEAVSLYLVYIFRKEDVSKERKRRHSSSSNDGEHSGDQGKRNVSK
uniref:mRNA (guanine-N(7))-methyltransferase n=1 Tax=Simocephalus serrulatus TaxID=117539 RepID=A0A4Y7NP39_9CRUS|nr:EOG090X07I2 [Simocephalus serrulatus]